MKLSVVLPCFNEEKNAERIEMELLPGLDRLGPDYEVIAVDDGSTDGTADVLSALSRKNPKVRVTRHETNQGLGQAVRTGISQSMGEAVLTLDADFTFHPNQIPELWKRYQSGDADCVIGSPYLGRLENVPLNRKVLSWGGNLVYKILLGQKITAVSPIFRIYKAEKLKKLELSSTDFDINAEILFKLLQNGTRIVEIPAVLTTRIYGYSKLKKFRAISRHLGLLFKILLWRIAH